MEILTELFKLSIGGLTIAGIIIFLGKLLINKSSEIILQNHKNNLEILKTEHQIKFSQLHSERGKIIKELYQNLFELEKRLLHLTTFAQGTDWKYDSSREELANEKLNETRNLVETNRIFFPEELCIRILESLEKFDHIIDQMGEAKIKAKMENLLQKSRKLEGEKSTDIWKKTNLLVKNEIRPLRLELANDFRRIIEV